MLRSASVPKITKGRERSRDSLLLVTSVYGNESQLVRRVNKSGTLEKYTSGGRRKTQTRKRFISGQFMQALGVSPSNPSLTSLTTTDDLKSQGLTSQNTDPKLDFLSHLALYSRDFALAIQASGALEPVLTRIKTGYEGLIEDLMDRNKQEEAKLKNEIEQCGEYREELRRALKRNRNLEEEVMKLRKKIEDLRSNCQELEASNAKNAVLSFPGSLRSFEESSLLVSASEESKEIPSIKLPEESAVQIREQKPALVVRAVKRRESWGERIIDKKPSESETDPDLHSQVTHPRRTGELRRIRTQPDGDSDSSISQ